MSGIRIGATVPNAGRAPFELGMPAMARRLEASGFDSLWVADHIVLPTTMGSWYPFADDGRATWPSDTPYVEALVALALVAAATERVRIGTAVLVLPLRNPVLAAKQAASIDIASGGRLVLGVGAGWLREEFDALGVPFDDRGRRLVEWMEIARDCWTGAPPARSSERYTVPEGILCLPAPARPIPFLIGGHSPAALRRAGRLADGWLPQQELDELDTDALRAGAAAVRGAAAAAGREPDRIEVVLRLIGSQGRGEDVARVLPALAAAGVDEVILTVDWNSDDPDALFARAAAGRA